MNSKNDSATSQDFIEQLDAARIGSKEQQAELLETFRGYLRSLASRTLAKDGPNGRLSASDLVQSAIIDACKDFSRCRAGSEAEFKAWLRQIMMNDILNRYRYLRRQKRDVAREMEYDTGRLASPESDSPASIAQRREEEGKLNAAIEKLKLEHQQVIRFRHQDKLTFVDIGKQMNRSPDAVRMLWNRAVEELSKVL